MLLSLLYSGSALFQFLAVWQSIAFVSAGRLGRVWSLVSVAIFLKGLLSIWVIFSYTWITIASFTEQPVAIAEFFISLLLASGFLLTGQWFRFRERLEARVGLITEVGRCLGGGLGGGGGRSPGVA